jgi:serine/threonine protein kinase/Tfp pilus assembly protein PilF
MSDAASAPTVALPALRLQVGSIFADRYEVLSVLGSGGVGDVYRVRDVELSEEVALKVLRPEIAEAPGALDRFRREVKLARRVTHPNVARTYDLGTFDRVRYLTMELILGKPLSRFVGRGRKVPLADALRIASEVVRGLAAAHAAGVVHRDLKPDNILLGELDGRVVITDFGIARLAEGTPGQATRLTLAAGASAVGTPAYMAPEQLEEKELDGRADLYAFGVVLFEMLTGELPFHGDTIYSLAASRLSSPPVDPRSLDAAIPDGVAALVLDALARHRDDRIDAQQALDRLEAIRGGGPYEERAPVTPPQSSLAQTRTDAIGVSSIELGVLAQASARKTLAVAPFSTVDAAMESGSRDLGRALADALTGLPGFRTLCPGSVYAAAQSHVHEGTLDASAFGRAVAADVVVEGSLRVASGKVRARVRTFDVARGVQTWADRFEGSVDDPFSLEDRLIAGVDAAMRTRTTDVLGRPGPSDPSARAVYDRARAAYNKYALPHVREAIHLIEEGLTRTPDEPYLLSLLGTALVRAWLMMGASDRSMIVRAEEVSLRALAADPTIADTYYTIGIVRGSQGELRAAVRAFQDAVARNPLLSEPHSQLGRWMSESGRLEEGSHRLDLAIRLDPQALYAYLERARNFALTGDRQRTEQDLARAERVGGPMATVLLRMRLAVWWNDRAMAAACADTIEAAKSGGAFDNAIPQLRAMAKGEIFAQAVQVYDAVADAARASSRQRSLMLQIASEYFASIGDVENALVRLERAVELPMVDLLWLDHCPSFEEIRKLPRFAKARAIVAARAAQLWS